MGEKVNNKPKSEDECADVNCDRPRYKYKKGNTTHINSKCVLHCEKTEDEKWYTVRNNEKMWAFNKVKEFWEAVRKINKNKPRSNSYFFYYINFPRTEFLDVYVLRNPRVLGRSYNFWEEDTKTSEIILKHSLNFKDCIFLGTFKLENIEFKEIVKFEGCHFYDDFEFVNNECTELLFENCKFDKKFSINHLEFKGDYPKLIFKDCSFNDRVEIGEIHCKLLNIEIENVKFYGSAISILHNLGINEFNISKLDNFSESLYFKNIIASYYFKVENSTLKNVSFIKCPFCTTSWIVLKNISLDNTKFNSVDWGKIDKEHIDAERDIIRQLKHANDQQGNYIQANKFYALEMEKYGDEIKDSKNYLEKIVFTISKNLSNFSQDWLLPIFWFFFIGSMVIDIIILETPTTITIFLGIITFILCLKMLIILSIMRSGSMQYFKWFFLLLNGVFYQVFHYKKVIDLNEVILLLSPFNTKPDSTILVNVVFILFKLFTILIGYHLVTALRFHTRRK